MAFCRGQTVRFQPGCEQWAMGYRAGEVVDADASFAAFLRDTARRLPALLGAQCREGLQACEREGDRRGVVVRVFPCKALPAGLEVMTPAAWLEPVAAGAERN